MTHQRNYLRKEELQRQTDAYDAEIRSKIRQIADTRKELKSIPAYNASDAPTRMIDVEELLRYAKFISRTTVPPTLPKQEVKQEEGAKPSQLTNGTSSPPADTQMQDANGASAEKAEEKAEETARVLTDDQRWWISQQSNFLPWPSNATFQRGALATIQKLVEAGQDPAAVLSAEEQAEAEQRKREDEERERAEMEERERSWAAGGGGRRRETVEEVFNPDEM